MYITILNKKNPTCSILKIQNTKQSVIIGIALLVSFLINLPRLLTLLKVFDSLGDSFNEASFADVLVRFIVLSTFSWLALQYNTNWKNIFSQHSKVKSTLISIAYNTILFLVAINVFQFIYSIVVSDPFTRQELNILYFVYFVVLIILIFVSGILRYQLLHQQDVIEKETLKQQSLLNELEALKNQINPHFLFNSLNSLNSLVRDNKPATTFVNKLSFMYRYILQSRTNDMVSLKEELKFLDSYIYLIKTRYKDRFDIDIDIDDQLMQEEIPSMSLQLLVENAVKHNEISESNPLLVKVYTKDNNIVVENKIKTRTTFVDSTGNGLVNLNKRYTLLKKKAISISDSSNIFKVELPLDKL